MKGIVRHIAFLLTALLALCGVSACIHKEGKPGGEEPENDPQALFVLHISPVNTRADASTDVVAEKIKSLRVIAISKDEEGQNGVIEINRKVTFDNVVAVEKFGYSLTWRTRAGKKDFYIFANEESVTNIQFTEDTDLSDLPENLKANPTLTNLLDYYKATPASTLTENGPSTGSHVDITSSSTDLNAAKAQATAFSQVINAVYFAPNYKIEGGTVYLPYTTFYGNVDVAKIEEEEEDDVNRTADDTPYPMFLVPVATKFTFHFHNYRTNNVEIQKIEVSSTHTENFLLAQVGEKDHDKTFGDENTPYYWVDWLAKVSEESQKTADSEDKNVEFNKNYGWISDYAMPKPDKKDISHLVSLSEQTEQTAPVIPKGEIDHSTDEIQPKDYSLGPFYVPESRNLVSEGDGATAEKIQKYYLTLHLKDASENVKEFNLSIDNLEALFRNTSVIIDITLREGEVGVYAEIVPWNVKSANGWLIEGNAPNGNLFSAQNK